MAKRGRPKNTQEAKNRRISIIPDETAYKIYIAVSNARNKRNWIHEYLSEKLKEDFAQEFQEAIRIQELHELEKQRDQIEDKLRDKAKEINQIRQKKAKKEIQNYVNYTANLPIDG